MILTKDLRKYINSLQRVKYRQKYNKFVAEGPKICFEFITQARCKIEYIVCTKELLDEHKSLLADYEGKTIICNDNELKSISSLKSPNKILIVLEQISQAIGGSDISSAWSLYLDRIQDPGNMGTIMRIADWFGLEWLLVSEDSCDFYNPKVVQAAMGAHARIQFAVLPRESLCRDYAGEIQALSLGGEALSHIDKSKPGILVIGNESAGVSSEILDKAAHIWTIPKKGGAESLNASVACGIACYTLFSGV